MPRVSAIPDTQVATEGANMPGHTQAYTCIASFDAPNLTQPCVVAMPDTQVAQQETCGLSYQTGQLPEGALQSIFLPLPAVVAEVLVHCGMPSTKVIT